MKNKKRTIILGVFALLIIVLIVGGLRALEGSKQSKLAVAKPAAASSSVPSDAQSVSESRLCHILESGRQSLTSAAQRLNMESNPLKRDEINGEYRQLQQQFRNNVVGFVTKKGLTNCTGRVSAINVEHYNTGPGVILGITLPCNAVLSVQFVEITNPAWGSFNPQSESSLRQWRQVLESLAVNDVITFSGHFYLPYGPSEIPQLTDSSELALRFVVTDLVKGRIDLSHVPPLNAKQAIRIARKSLSIFNYRTAQIRRSAAFSSDRNWRSWKQFVGSAQLLESTLEKRGWSVSGFQIPGVGYYNIHGNFEPPASSRKWIIGTTPATYGQLGGYKIVLLTKPKTKVLSLSSHENTAKGTFSVTYSYCTEFGNLWKKARTMPDYIGRSIFGTNYYPAFDFDAPVNISVNFLWDQSRGWHVISNKSISASTAKIPLASIPAIDAL